MNKIPNPVACGLPEKFTQWRANQEQAIDVMITSSRRVTALSAPTGSGKSPAYVAYALLSGKPTCIVTNSKGLQSQLMNDYKSIGMVDIRGKANYPCNLREDYTCQEGYAARCPYKGTVQCPYSQAEMRAAGARLVVTNYDKWMYSSRSEDAVWMDHLENIVLDEGHDAPDALARVMEFTVTTQDIEGILQLKYPLALDSMGSWKAWAVHAKDVAEEKMRDWTYRLQEEMNPRTSWIRQAIHVKKLWKRLCVLSLHKLGTWVVEEVEGGFKFDPIRPGQYAEGLLFLQRKRIIIVSATLRPKTMYMLGLGGHTFDFREFDSDFDRTRCPIYWIPTMRVDVKAKDFSPLWVRLDQIMSKRADRKGIIHTISYARRDDVIRASRHRARMLINMQGELATSAVDAFKSSPPGTVLVSPSVGTGYDFPGRECEWQFITKIPFQDGRSAINKARQEADREYGPYQAMQSMVQAFGRGMRSKEDRCENFICDDHLAWFIPRYSHLAPKSFHAHFRKVMYVPQPPEAL